MYIQNNNTKTNKNNNTNRTQKNTHNQTKTITKTKQQKSKEEKRRQGGRKIYRGGHSSVKNTKSINMKYKGESRHTNATR